MRLPTNYLLGAINDALIEIIPEMRPMRSYELVEYLLESHDDEAIQDFLESNFIHNLRQSYATDIVNHIDSRIRGILTEVIPTMDFDRIEYNEYSLHLLGGAYEREEQSRCFRLSRGP